MEPGKSKRLSQEEKYRIVCECRSSGLPACKWLAEHEIYESSYYSWIKQLKRKAYELPPLSKEAVIERNEIVQINPVPEAIVQPVTFPACESQEKVPSVEIMLGGACIRAYEHTSQDVLTMVVRVIQGALC